MHKSRKTLSEFGHLVFAFARDIRIMSRARSRLSRFGFAAEFFGGVDGVVALPERVVTMTDV